ncbi:MAG: CoB--CoM heterodisulfide reductase iron-sulfur subunit B family protein [Desulfobacterales bacterium]
MKYVYYPGCSLEGSAREYDLSTRAFLAAVGAELIEIEGWTCCGASAAEATSRLLALTLPARNLALAEKIGGTKEMLVPCSACYLNLKAVEEKVKRDAALLDRINAVLAVEGLQYAGQIRVRHLLEVIVRDIGPGVIAGKANRSLAGISIAAYYGCQCLRPYAVFDDPEAPRSMTPLLEAAGAAVHHWDMGGKCCGASHMNTKMAVGMELVRSILSQAKGADAIVTVCPMCQMNLEAYQGKISKLSGENLAVSVLYLPQLLGLALGLSEQEVRLELNLAVTDGFRQKLRQPEPVHA